jgi:hypothetical protein
MQRGDQLLAILRETYKQLQGLVAEGKQFSRGYQLCRQTLEITVQLKAIVGRILGRYIEQVENIDRDWCFSFRVLAIRARYVDIWLFKRSDGLYLFVFRDNKVLLLEPFDDGLIVVAQHGDIEVDQVGCSMDDRNIR